MRKASSPRRWRRPSGCAPRGETRVALLFVVGEERGSDGARVANEQAPAGVRYLINGEPTDNRLGAATRGVLRVRLHAEGRAAHSSFPELGESAIDKLLDALMVIRGLQLPDDPLLGRTHYTVGADRRRRGAQRRLAARVGGAAVPDRRRRRARSAPRSRVVEGLVVDRARARHAGRADAHRAGLRDGGFSVHDRRAAADAMGHAAAASVPARFTSRTPTRSTSPSMSCIAAVDLYERLATQLCSRRLNRADLRPYTLTFW